MRRLPLMLSSVVLLVLAAASAAALPQARCDHDADDLRGEQARLLATNGPAVQRYRSAAEGREFAAQQAAPIRIVFSYDDLTESGASCTSTSGSVPSYRTSGGTISCSTVDASDADSTAQDNVLTDAKRSILQNQILPAAVERLQHFISVATPVSGTLVASSTTVCGDDFTVPSSHTSTGVASADLVVYVASSPVTGAAAFAGACAEDQQGRAVLGRMNFGTKWIQWDDNDAASNRQIVDIAVHELLHVLGITSTEFFRDGRHVSGTKRGKTVRMSQTASVLSYVRSWSGCSALEGAEIEDEQSSGPEGSHWERKLFQDEIMAGVVGSKVSGLTLGFLADLGVGYTIDLTRAETMEWGAGSGCGVYDNKCNTLAGGSGTYFCFDTDTSATKCTWDSKAIGTCSVLQYSSALASQFQYFSDATLGGEQFMDGCPYVKPFSNRNCTEVKTPTSNEVAFGYFYGENSRCFAVTNVLQDGFTSDAADGHRCLLTRCTSANAIEFTVGTSGTYAACGAEGSTTATPSGFQGSVTCPSASSICPLTSVSPPPPAPTTTTATLPPTPTTTTAMLPPTPTTTTATLPPTPSTGSSLPTTPTTVTQATGATPTLPTTVTTPTPTPPTTTASVDALAANTVLATITLQGNSFAAIRDNAAQWQELAISLQQDIAQSLGVAASQVVIRSMTIGSLIVDFGVLLSTSSAKDTVSASIPNLVGNTAAFTRTTTTYRAYGDATASALAPSAAQVTSSATSHSIALTAVVAVIVVLVGAWF